ncbi:cell adhesion molecule Dscam1-like isoform X2 [Centruroides vittatus]|uniref:cell adhesion molecule Dscam1-like isoform X2 n=1 Tax=Centruroides vittatus TaxID=120091 RepID=UPI00350F5504
MWYKLCLVSLILIFYRVCGGRRMTNTNRKGPQFIHEPPKQVEFLNTTGTVIPCSVYGNPTPIVKWVTEDGASVTDVRGLRHIRLDGTLVFHPFRAEEYRQDIHAIVYRCTATNSVGTIASRNVQVRAVISHHYSVETHDEFVLKGNTAVLRCHVPGFVREYVKVTAWFRKPNEEITASLLDGRYSLFPSGELHVRNVVQSDAASSYMCQAQHRLTGTAVLSNSQGRIVVTEPYGQVPPRITHSIPRIVIRRRETVQLPCAAQGYPLPSYLWYKKEGERYQLVKLDSRFHQIGGTLVIQQTDMKDSGKYLCYVNNTANEDKAETDVIVTAPLIVNISPAVKMADVGDFVTFNCTVTGYPVNTIRWLKNSRNVVDGIRVTVLRQYQLLISDIQREDRGMYQCFVFNDVESAQGTAELLITDNPPNLLYRFNDILSKPGSQVSLKCIAAGNPLPQITWTLDSMAVPEEGGFRTGDYVTSDNTVVSYVNVSDVSTEHGGQYTCTARNGAGIATHSGMLKVPGPPFIRKMKNRMVVAGETMILRCPVGGYPIDKITWERDGVRLPDNHRQTVYPNGTFLVRATERSADDGRYTCVAINKEGESAQGSINVTIRVRPVIEPFTLPASVHMGQRLSITCTVIMGDPPITIQWLRDNQPLVKQNDIKIHNLADYSSTLLFEAVKPNHRANYSCLAKNEAGIAQHNAAMVIHVPPRWKIEPRDLSVVKGRSVTIDCQADGFPPPRLSWRRAEGNIPESYKPISSNSHLHVFENGSLTILEVETDDSGYYLCQASNGIDSGLSKVIKLDVHIAAHFKSKFHAEIAKKGEDAKLKCEAFGERPLTVVWLKDKQPLDITENVRYNLQETVFNNATISELILYTAGRSDSALFTCIVSNSFGRDETNIQLLIQEPPDSPQELKVTGYSSRTTHISWSPPYSGNSRLTKYLLHYEVQRRDKSKPEKTKTLNIPATETSWSVTGLHPRTKYIFKLIAVNALGQSEQPAKVSVETDEEAPGSPPLSIHATPLSASTIKVTWSPPEEDMQYGKIRGYYVGYREEKSKEPHTYKTLEVGSKFKEETILNHLKRFTKYSIRVQAFNSKGTGPPSQDIIVQTLKEDLPKTPTPELVASTSSTITLKWNKQIGDENSLKGVFLYYRKEYGEWKEIEVRSEQDSFMFENLNCGMRYEFYLTPFNDVGKGEKSDIIFGRTTGRAPEAPERENLLQFNSTSISIRLDSWKNGGCPIKFFEIRYKQQKEKQWYKKFDRVNANEKVFLIKRLNYGTSYQLQVTAHNEAGSTQAEYTFSTPPQTKGKNYPDSVLLSNERSPFYLELEVILPVSLSIVVVLAVLVLVCIIMRKRTPSESTHSGLYGSSTYENRKVRGGQEAMLLAELEKATNQRSVGRSEPTYYPSPYATTHLAESGERKLVDANCSDIFEEPQYATVKRTPRPPKSDVHIYHYPVHNPVDLAMLDDADETSSHWGGHSRSRSEYREHSGRSGRHSARLASQ